LGVPFFYVAIKIYLVTIFSTPKLIVPDDSDALSLYPADKWPSFFQTFRNKPRQHQAIMRRLRIVSARNLWKM
jgi:hypothetical protein